MQFGFTLKPDHTIERTLALTRQAEAAGFDYGWLFDSHVLWRDPYPLLTLMAGATERLRLGTCVTNPATREPSVTASALAVLDEISGGRMDLGIGRGDSARRVLGKPPTTMATLEEAIVVIRDLVEGRAVDVRGHRAALPWTGKWKLPVWVAGYGPMALAMTGRVADGVILQLADPDLIRWFVGQVRDAEKRRRPAARARSGSRPRRRPTSATSRTCRERTRWFPALVSNHVVDLVNKYPREQLPESLTGYIRDRTGYDYHHHAEVGSSNAAFVGDEVTDRFCVLGSVDEHVAKLHELADGGRRPVQHLPDERRRGGRSSRSTAARSCRSCERGVNGRLSTRVCGGQRPAPRRGPRRRARVGRVPDCHDRPPASSGLRVRQEDLQARVDADEADRGGAVPPPDGRRRPGRLAASGRSWPTTPPATVGIRRARSPAGIAEGARRPRRRVSQ